MSPHSRFHLLQPHRQMAEPLSDTKQPDPKPKRKPKKNKTEPEWKSEPDACLRYCMGFYGWTRQESKGALIFLTSLFVLLVAALVFRSMPADRADYTCGFCITHCNTDAYKPNITYWSSGNTYSTCRSRVQRAHHVCHLNEHQKIKWSSAATYDVSATLTGTFPGDFGFDWYTQLKYYGFTEEEIETILFTHPFGHRLTNVNRSIEIIMEQRPLMMRAVAKMTEDPWPAYN